MSAVLTTWWVRVSITLICGEELLSTITCALNGRWRVAPDASVRSNANERIAAIRITPSPPRRCHGAAGSAIRRCPLARHPCGIHTGWRPYGSCRPPADGPPALPELHPPEGAPWPPSLSSSDMDRSRPARPTTLLALRAESTTFPGSVGLPGYGILLITRSPTDAPATKAIAKIQPLTANDGTAEKNAPA